MKTPMRYNEARKQFLEHLIFFIFQCVFEQIKLLKVLYKNEVCSLMNCLIGPFLKIHKLKSVKTPDREA